MRVLSACLLLLGASALACAQSKTPTAAESLKQSFGYINQKVLVMAQDFPESKYDYRLKPEMRSFGEVIVHIASGIAYAAKAGRGENVKWDELDAKNYGTKAECVALMQKWIGEANTALTQNPEGLHGSLEPFLSVLQHSSEHYGLLVAYYRANGLVPPDSRPKK
ncbi:MAG: DinB family protein [Bryobacteraceae bacterium]